PAAFAAIAMRSGLPATDVVRTGRAMTFASRAERDRRWPQLAGIPSRVEAVATLPLTVAGSTIGCLAIGFAEERELDDEDLQFLSVVADHTAIAVDRARLFASEREARTLLEFLADASRAVAATLDPLGVLSTLGRLAVPRLADWSAVYLPADGALRRCAVTVREHQDVADRLVGRFPVGVDSDTPVARAFRRGTAEVVPEVTPDMIGATSQDPELADAVSVLSLRSGIAVPVRSPGAGPPHAVLTLAFSTSGRTYSAPLVECVEELCARAGAAIDTASRYQRQRRIATTLTEAVLPRGAARVSGVDVAARYLPVDVEAGDVGGDWFDTWPLPDGRLLVGIGDVAGHGLPAATRMALFRHAARACALDDADPAALLGRLNRLAVLEGDEDALATALYGVLDPRDGSFRWASAGHLPPVRVSSGAGRPLEAEPGPPLGADAGAAYRAHLTDLAAGDLVVLYTDGVVETTTVAIDESIELLAGEAVGLAAEGDLERACELLMSRCLRDRSRTDDCCVVLVRMPGTAAAALPADALGASATTAASPARPPGGHRPPRRRRRAPRRPKAPGAPGAAGGAP
ncbi:MAG TPA: SpoIIE family protein phosphatase, partial [Acidimicrobiales bacterium]|nr:SpoIIE family protein phosphatase [Acidimicrobiales bacterium]